jgi:hypothetical protein
MLISLINNFRVCHANSHKLLARSFILKTHNSNRKAFCCLNLRDFLARRRNINFRQDCESSTRNNISRSSETLKKAASGKQQRSERDDGGEISGKQIKLTDFHARVLVRISIQIQMPKTSAWLIEIAC